MAARQKTNDRGERPRRDVNAAMRALQAIDLIAAGHSYREAAQLAGYASSGACHDAVQRELDRVVVRHVETLRRLHLRRLQRLRKVYLPKAEAGDGWSMDRCLRMDEREAALMGLDAKGDGANAGTVIVREYPAGVAEAV